MLINLLTTQLLGLRLRRTVPVAQRGYPRDSRKACSEKGSDRGKRYLFLRNAVRASEV